MNYAHVRDNIVYELIPESDPLFPGIPIDQRFAPDIVALCEPVADNVQAGYVKTETGFEPPPIPEPIPIPDPIPPEPTELEKLHADVDYIAMETGVILDV